MDALLHAGESRGATVLLTHSSSSVVRVSDSDSDAVRVRVSDSRKLTLVSYCLSCVVIFIALSNTAIVAHQFIGNKEWDTYFPMQHSLPLTIAATCVWYFFGYGWGLSIIFVCLPSYVFTLRVEEYATYIEESVVSFDIEQAMCWYDDLYHFNKILNNIASPLVTANVVLCFPLTVFLILSFTNREVSSLSALSWITINIVVMLLSTGAVANLYAANYRITMALGEKLTSDQFKANQIAGYQLALLKVKAIPFGVRFYATRQHITPSIVFRALALVSSFFVFLKAQQQQ